jgi:nucleoside-diphosphate-sugar epimerase
MMAAKRVLVTGGAGFVGQAIRMAPGAHEMIGRGF